MGKKDRFEKTCDNCSECIYIGEGDSVCLAEQEPKLVMEDHLPSDNYYWCCGKEWKR